MEFSVNRMFAFLVALTLTSAAADGQELDAVPRWAVIASGYNYSPDIVYTRANGQDLKLDVISIDPKTKPRPTVLYIHGGGWVNGTKGNTTLAALPFLARGMDVVNIDYRVASDSLAPAAVEDCRCALRWVYRHAKDYGFDTTKIVVAGESAGGHLALTTAMLDASAGFDNACPVQEGDEPLKAAAVVSYSGPTDVAELLEGPHQQWFALMWFGSLPDRARLARRLSPLSYVRPGLPPIILAHGDRDPYVPYEQAMHLHEALDRIGDPNQLITVAGPTHGWALEIEWAVQQQMFNALEKYGILPRNSTVGADRPLR
jgi:acetyl esterase/lipase